MIDETRMSSFLASLDPEEPEWLARLREEAQADGVPIIREETQRLLRFLVRSRGVSRILEIGTGTGYSALLMWEASGRTARITTIENYARRYEAAQGNITAQGAQAQITLLMGDAVQILPDIQGEDAAQLVFMDAAKGQYPAFLPEVTRLLTPGGVLVTDNLWQDGDVLESRYAVRRRDRTIHARMRDYLYEITHSADYETLLLDIGDGVGVSVRK